jgi:hypothetical protein
MSGTDSSSEEEEPTWVPPRTTISLPLCTAQDFEFLRAFPSDNPPLKYCLPRDVPNLPLPRNVDDITDEIFQSLIRSKEPRVAGSPVPVLFIHREPMLNISFNKWDSVQRRPHFLGLGFSSIPWKISPRVWY